MKTYKSMLSSAVGIITFLLVVGVGRAYPGASIGIFIAGLIVLASVWAGAAYGRWYLNKEHINKGWLGFLFWSNLITWLLPPIGIFTGTATYTLNSKNNGADRDKYSFLAWFSIVLSLINGAVGVLSRLKV